MSDGTESVPEPIGIVLADDHPLIRTGLRRVLDLEGGVTVLGEAGDIDGALRLTRAHQPRVVVLDLNMPGTPTLAAIPLFLEAAPGIAVLVLTMEAEPGFAQKALIAGARGYVLKDTADTELLDAVRSVVAGRTYLDPHVGARMAQSTHQPSGPPGLSRDDPELAVGSEFAGHRIDGFVGRGGMGLVFRATDRALNRSVALKVIAPEVADRPVFRARFKRECRLAAAIDHPHVVQVFQAGEEDGLLYLTMRYVDGKDLGELLRERGRLEPARTGSILEQVAGALDEAHRLGLVHRDVKPANVLIASSGGRDHAFLTDFGITRHDDEERLTRTGLALGSADYMAPEQARGDGVDARADIYSLGCVLYEMLTGRLVFDRGGELEKMWAHVHERPPRLPPEDFPPGLQTALDRALAKDPRERYQTAADLAADLAGAFSSR